jgi:hypothetical protein
VRVGSSDFGSAGLMGAMLCGFIAPTCFKRCGLCGTFPAFGGML